MRLKEEIELAPEDKVEKALEEVRNDITSFYRRSKI